MSKRDKIHISEAVRDQQFIIDLYQQYKRLMFFTAEKYAADENVREELVQESLLKLIQKADALRSMEHSTLVTYICSTVRNTSLNYLMSVRKESGYMFPEEEAPEYDSRFSGDRAAEDEILLSKLKDELKSVLKRLSEKDRTLLIRKYQYQLSDVVLARIFNCNVNNIRMMLTRAKRRAIRAINEESLAYGNI